MAGEREALIALNMVPDTGPVTWRRLLGIFGSATAILDAGADGLCERAGFGRERAVLLADELSRADAAHEIATAAKMGIRIVTLNDSQYPEILKKIHDPPMVLYCFGDMEAFAVAAVAMVGTRNPTLYGVDTAHRFAFAIASAGYCVVSGMARGIDAASHKGALDAKGRTIGVLGGAIDCFYPSENKELARKVAKSGGLIISEFPLGRKPDRTTFPMRNCIISGLSRLTLVVEAAAKSGSLITATSAAEQGRLVMAVPGRIDVPNSLGCNLLIRDGSSMALSPDDILDELATLDFSYSGGAQEPVKTESPASSFSAGAARAVRKTSPSQSASRGPVVPLTDEESRVLDAIGAEETLIDEVIRHSQVEAGRANALLLALQLKRLVEVLPGGWVRRKRR